MLHKRFSRVFLWVHKNSGGRREGERVARQWRVLISDHRIYMVGRMVQRRITTHVRRMTSFLRVFARGRERAIRGSFNQTVADVRVRAVLSREVRFDSGCSGIALLGTQRHFCTHERRG